MQPPWYTLASPPASLATPAASNLGAEEAREGLGMSASPIGTMAEPPSVFCRWPVSGMTSNRGDLSVKKAGLPHPAVQQQC